MKIATLNLHRYFFTLLVVLPLSSPLSAQETDEDDKFFLGFAGSAVFPYDPNPLAGLGLKAGSGFTAAFGYAFKEGFSTEMEWEYQKVGIDQPPETFFQGIPSRINVGGIAGPEDFPFPSRSIADITFEIDGEIKTQSLMGNVYYRYPKWRVSPYAGFGLGVFFHDGTFTSTVTIENPPIIIGEGVRPIGLPTRDPLDLRTTAAREDSRFAYQIMAGLSARVSQNVEFHFGYRFRSSRGGPSIPTRLRAASGSGFDANLKNGSPPILLLMPGAGVLHNRSFTQSRPGCEAQLR